ncbi:MAG: hypothetical protein ABIR46_04615 [Candidatus Saccharimonadales bacterium]
MDNINEHPGTFRDGPEERTLHVKVKLQPGTYAEQGSSQQTILDAAIQQTLAETGVEPAVRVVDSRLYPKEPSYEARLLGVGSETFFHALGGACMRKMSEENVSGVSDQDVSWRINASQSMLRLVRFE